MADTEEWFPQGSGLASFLNSYTNDQFIHPNTRNLLCVDDLCIVFQKQSFEEVEISLTNAVGGLIPYYHLQTNPGKIQNSAFHLLNRETDHQLKINFVWKTIRVHFQAPVYLGVTLDHIARRTLQRPKPRLDQETTF